MRSSGLRDALHGLVCATVLICSGSVAAWAQGNERQGSGWRGALWQKASLLMRPGSGANMHHAYEEAGKAIEAQVKEAGTLSDADRLFADSLLMELGAADALAYGREGHPAQAVISYRTALKHALAPELTGRQVSLTCALAAAQRQSGNVDAALRVLDDDVRRLQVHKDTNSVRRLLLEKSYLCRDLGLYDKAIEANLAILAIDMARKDDRGLIGTELALSRCYEGLGSGEAFIHANNAYDLAERSGNDQGLLDATERLIASYNVMSQLDKCRDLLERALAKARVRGIPADIAKFEDIYGRFYMRMGEYDEAIKHHERGINALAGSAEALNTLTAQRLGTLHQDLGTCYLKLEDRPRALQHLLASDSLASLAGPGAVAPWADLGEIYLEEGQVAKAAAFGTRALDQGRADRDTRMIQRASKVLYEVYKRKGDMGNALAMHELFKTSSDSLRNESYTIDLIKTQLGMQHRAELLTDSLSAAAREEKLRADRETTRQRTRVLIGGGVAIFIAAALVAFVDRKRRLARFDKEAAQLETQALRSQMNPHFIFNALNSINSFVQKNDPDRASSYLSKFARLMRLVLENSRQAEVPLKDDLEALDHYLNLERSRGGDKFDYAIKVDPDIDQEDVLVPPLVAQPFVENAIWHGMAGRTEKGHITLSVSRKGEDLIFAIEDDGVGRHAPKTAPIAEADAADGVMTKKTSLGTTITKARLDLVSQQKGRPAGFKYIDLPHGTRVELTLPISTTA